MINTALVLNYLAPVSLCYNDSFLYDLFSSIHRHPLVFQKKGCFKFWSAHPLAFQEKVVLMKIVGDYSVKHPFWSPLFKCICRPSRFTKYHSPCKVHVHFRHSKESMPKKFQMGTGVYACDHMSHMIKPELVIYILFLDQDMCVSQ